MMKTLSAALFLGLATTACVDRPDVGGDSLGLGAGSGSREQGRWQLGGIADGLMGPALDTMVAGSWDATVGGVPTRLSVTAPATAGPCLRATVGGVVHTCADPIFDGVVLTGPSSGAPRLRIVGSLTFTIAGEASHVATGYRLQHNAAWASGGPPSWVPYCTGDRLAYPLAGTAQRDGTFKPGVAAISFACSEFGPTGVKPTGRANLVGNGVVAKAMSWGFVPGSNGTDWLGAGVNGADLHHAAVTAGRAAYCGDGVPHTLDATSIRIFDMIDGNLAETASGPIEASPTESGAPVDPTSFSLESAWKGKDPSWGPLCLSKLRWQALPLGDRCAAGTVLHDPRLDPDSHFCDDMSLFSYADLAAAGGVLSVYSQWNDLGLWRWQHVASGDQYTTTIGAYSQVTASTEPAGGYDPAVHAPLFEGTVMTAVGKEIFEANYGAGAGTLVELQSCRQPAGGDRATARPAWLATHGYTAACTSEGFVWAMAPSPAVLTALGWTMRELKLWQKAGDVATATTVPGVGYGAPIASVGWIVAPATW